SSHRCRQLQVCQMPKSLCRMAGRRACSVALRNSSLGTVSSAGSDRLSPPTCPPSLLTAVDPPCDVASPSAERFLACGRGPHLHLEHSGRGPWDLGRCLGEIAKNVSLSQRKSGRPARHLHA